VANDNPVATEGVEVLVIGGGQAGLAMGHHLAELGLTYVIADANPEVGHMWRSRWQSLKLFTAGQFNDLPGMRFPADRDSYPGKDDVADFLQAYVERFELPVRLETTVTRLSRADSGGYLAETTTSQIRADQVVIATGRFKSHSRRGWPSRSTRS
jgi:putative flavoprotein involved in K+ transport